MAKHWTQTRLGKLKLKQMAEVRKRKGLTIRNMARGATDFKDTFGLTEQASQIPQRDINLEIAEAYRLGVQDTIKAFVSAAQQYR